MAKWGRRGWLSRMVGQNRQLLWSNRPYKRVKTISWGSRSSAASSSGVKWRSRKPAVSRANAWGGIWQPRKRIRPVRAVSARPGKPAAGAGGWGSKPTAPKRRRRLWITVTLLILLFGTVQSFVYIEKHLRPPLMQLAQLRIKQVATQAINKATTEEVADSSDLEKLIDWKMNSNGKISGFMLNYAEHTKIRAQTINTVQATLDELKGIPEHIPIGNALGSAIISSYGPRIPVKFEPVGAVKVDLNTRQKNAGINMILIEVYIRIVAEVAIIVPFETDPQQVETEIPISYLLVVGDVPMYYYDNKGNPVGESAANAPNISVPLANGTGVTKPSSGTGAEAGTGVTQPSDGSMIQEYLEDSANPLGGDTAAGGSGNAAANTP